MRQITIREKTFLGIGILAAISIIAYFALLPILRGGQSESSLDLKDMQEKLAAVQELDTMNPMLAKLEKRMKDQTGYKEMLFNRGTANATIMLYVSQAASNAGIKELEQLDPKPDKSRNSNNGASNLAALKSVMDQLYLCQVLDEAEQAAKTADESKNNPPVEQADSDGSKANKEASSGDKPSEDKPAEEKSNSEKPEKESETEDSVDDLKQSESGKPTFPLIPKNIPDEVRKSLVKYLEKHQGKTTTNTDINSIMDDAGVEDEAEREQVRNHLKIYNDRVKEKKNEIAQWAGKIGISQNSKAGDRLGRFDVKMVFKSQMDQLVKFLYNLQDSAKWIKIESIRISISDRKQNILAVELSMAATTLYGL